MSTLASSSAAQRAEAPTQSVGPGFAFPDFQARVPWLTGDLQTLRNYFVKPRWDLSPWPEERFELALGDGSGDRLLAKLHAPAEAAGRPLAVLVHGLTGCEDSSYIRRTALTLLQAGFPVLRLNLRGAGPGRALAEEHYHAGRSQDLRAALAMFMEQKQEYRGRGLLAVGYSLGANMLLKLLGERPDELPLVAAAAVSAPIDPKAAQVRIMEARNRVYHRYLLQSMKEESKAPASLLDRIETIYDFDDKVVALANGFDGAEDYYRRSGAKNYLGEISVPTLVVHAEDDPWIPVAAYRAFDWSANPKLTLLLAQGGGHVGFHGRGSRVPWHDRCILRFFEELAA